MRDAGARAKINPRVMLHIAQPEHVERRFAAATAAEVRDCDVIGISCYRKSSTRSVPRLGETNAVVRARYGKDVILVETAYPFTNDGADVAANLLGPDTLIPGCPATPEGRRGPPRRRRGCRNHLLGAGLVIDAVQGALANGVQSGERDLVRPEAQRSAARVRLPAAQVSSVMLIQRLAALLAGPESRIKPRIFDGRPNGAAKKLVPIWAIRSLE